MRVEEHSPGFLSVSSGLTPCFARSICEDGPGLSIASLSSLAVIGEKSAPRSTSRCLLDQVVDPLDEKLCIVGTGANGLSMNKNENRRDPFTIHSSLQI